ncbi:sulfite oxidase heme-binding subunit YedZ [Marinobacter koreensis]|uniref:Protein-methionine-sulfoxide reductase heme-binding subunit MsrQ n=1 Tax=Marinobacter koreensis TaxID=335974 RepID=A0ABW0RM66_9GAMM|nr:protein-methionine-sulfoxide reductase heme-binding subunit MsrQ [Marinobacter koreensis]MCK7549864.1 sulfoxide reductase heme-binding subunit YedZ [Marinobacter koreensis]
MSRLRMPLFRLLVFVGALLPFALLVMDAFGGRLGPDPGERLTERLGLLAFQCLLVTLFMTPLSRWTGSPIWIRVRRMLGLFAFFYAVLHLLAFLQFVIGWEDLWVAFTKRPYIVFGTIALLLMCPLAITSTRGMMKRLGRSWKPLHRLIYLALVFAWLHFLWQARSDVGEMMAYAVIAFVLLGVRVYWFGWRTLVPIRRA